MGRGRLPFLRALWLGFCMLSVGLLSAKSAQADPHGVFFTVVGQQQLFFNILAALNQADYVEPLQLRQQLSQGRNAAGYAPSSDSRLRETATDLADVLTRSVSLEGQDVRTQERSDEYAREVVRQRRVAELIKQYCQEAFGAPDCAGTLEEEEKKAPKRKTGREQSFIQDPVAYARLPYILGVIGALTSGTKEHEDFALEILREGNLHEGIALPFEYSPVVAAWRKEAEKGGDAQAQVKAIDRMVEVAARSFLAGGIDPGFWKDVRIDSNGKAEIDIGPSDDFGRPMTPAKATEKFFRNFNTLVTIPATLDRIARNARQSVDLQLNSTLVDGAVPDRDHIVGVLPNGDIARISTSVTTPANVKVGLQQQLLPLLAQLEGNPKFADPAQVDNDTGESAVDREGKDPLKIGTPLEALQHSDVIEKGLRYNTGIQPRAGLNRHLLNEFLKPFLEAIIKKKAKAQ